MNKRVDRDKTEENDTYKGKGGRLDEDKNLIQKGHT